MTILFEIKYESELSDMHFENYFFFLVLTIVTIESSVGCVKKTSQLYSVP